MNLFTEGATGSYAHHLGSILPAGILVSGRVDPGGHVLEIALEECIEASQVLLVDVRGAIVATVPLESRAVPMGCFWYGECPLDPVPDRLDLIVQGGSGRDLPGFRFGLDLTLGRCFPTPRFEGLLSPVSASSDRLISYGPRGVDRCPGLLNALRMVSDTNGIELELIIDDGGEAQGISLGYQRVRLDDEGDVLFDEFDRLEFDLPLAEGHRRFSVTLPLGVDRVECQLHGAHGESNPDAHAILDIGLESFIPPPPSPKSRPSERIEASPSANPATGAGGPRAGPSLNLASEFESYFDESVRTRSRPSGWPDSIGASGSSLGPKGILGGAAALRIESLTRLDSEIRVTLALDDSGVVSSITVAENGQALGTYEVVRGTDFAIGIVHVPLIVAGPDPILLARDRFGAVIPNLSARFDKTERSFRPEFLDPGVWYPTFFCRAPLDFEIFFCAVCRVPVRQEEGMLLVEVDPQIRRHIRSQRELNPDLRGVCTRCHDRLKDSFSLWTGSWHYMSPAYIGPAILRFILAIPGALIPLTGLGASLSRSLGPGILDLMSEADSMVFISILGAAGFVALPFSWFMRPLKRSSEFLMNPKTEAPRPRTLVLPVLIVLLLLLSGRSRTPDAVWVEFVSGVFPLTTIIGFVIGLSLRAVLRIVDFLTEDDTIQYAARDHRAGEIFENATQLTRCRNIEELEMLLPTFVSDGMRAGVFQIFKFDIETGFYTVWHSQNRSQVRIPILKFQLDEMNLPSQCATLGRPLSRRNLEWDKGVDATRLEDAVSLLCLPIGRNGSVSYVIRVLAFRDPQSLEILSLNMRGVTFLLDQALDSAHQPSRRVGGSKTNKPVPSREALVDTFGAYFPPDFIQRAQRDVSILSLEGDEAEVTLMTVQIFGLDRLPPPFSGRDRLQLVSGIYETLIPAIVGGGGFIERIEGSRLCAMFGRPQNLATHTESAIVVALHLPVHFHEFVNALPLDPMPDLAVGIGIVRGAVVIGNMGTSERFEYGALSPLRRTSRILAGLTASYGINILATTPVVAQIGERGSFRILDRVLVEGESELLDFYEIISFENLQPNRLSPVQAAYHHEAFMQYLAGDYTEAGRGFAAILDEVPDDVPAGRLVGRCEDLAVTSQGAEPPIQQVGVPLAASD